MIKCWDEMAVLKLASLMEVFCLPDCAAELLQIADKRNMLNLELTPLLNNLTPILRKGVTSRFISYHDYLQYFNLGS